MANKAELIELRDVLLKHALGGSETYRQHCALRYIFERHIEEGEHCRYILLEHIITQCPSAARKANEAVHRLKGDITLKLDAFYGESHSKGERPHPAAAHVKHRATFKEKATFYWLSRRTMHPKPKRTGFRASGHRICIPMAPPGFSTEPFFLIDEQRTLF